MPIKEPNIEDDLRARRWMIDRHIPVAIVIALILQTGTWIWWAASFSTATTARLDVLEQQHKITAMLPERMARQEVMQESTNMLLREIRDDIRMHRGAVVDNRGVR